MDAAQLVIDSGNQITQMGDLFSRLMAIVLRFKNLRGLTIMLTIERLKELLHYDPETGVFTRLVCQGMGHAGEIAGSWQPDRKGAYRVIKLDGKQYRASRLAVLYVTGVEPRGQVDHINLDKGDNRLCNLRAVTQQQNRANVSKYRNNTSGIKGVSRHNNGWTAVIQTNRKFMYLGMYKEKYEAAAIYAVASALFHGEYGRIK